MAAIHRPPVIPDGLLLQAEHITLDCLKSSDDTAAVLKAPGVRSDYVFFYWYIPMPLKPSQDPRSNAKGTATVNMTRP
ncbi:hypothetical protein B0J12DRAFT_780238 [Macrophomina phaseolina]|uniref:Uncharacterized protein n=1 Tax=Macrophomina phaseolina TaxID=35725 RepID=A0ABQ8GU03_9PEZI|nr:hypothetical protein B0J12DRAFT_780238 [Macrophomina phaseolina]